MSAFRTSVVEIACSGEVLALPGSQDFQQYIHMDRSLKPRLMRPSLVLVRKAIDRMWFRRHWYWPSGYIVVGFIVALLTDNIHLSSLSGILLSILAVLLSPSYSAQPSAASWAFTSRASISPDPKVG